jgi:hypothetical protein
LERLVDNYMEGEVKIKKRVEDLALARKRKKTHFLLIIKIMDTKVEEEDLGKNLEEEAFMEPILNAQKKEIEAMSVLTFEIC